MKSIELRKSSFSIQKIQEFFGESDIFGPRSSASSANAPLLASDLDNYLAHDLNLALDDNTWHRRFSDSTLVESEERLFPNEVEERIVQNREKINKFFGKEQVPILVGAGSSIKTSRRLGIESFKLRESTSSK